MPCSLNTKNTCVHMHVYVLPKSRALANFEITITVNIINSPETFLVMTHPSPRILKEILWKGGVLTWFDNLLCDRHSVRGFPGNFQGRGCYGFLPISFLPHYFPNQLQISSHVFFVSGWTHISAFGHYTQNYTFHGI